MWITHHGAQPRARGMPEPPAGPLVQWLRSFLCKDLFLILGPWDHGLIAVSSLARSRAESIARSSGTEGGAEAGAGDSGVIMGQIRRTFSVQAVRSQSLCFFGPRPRVVGERRKVVQRLVEECRRQAAAYNLTHRQ